MCRKDRDMQRINSRGLRGASLLLMIVCAVLVWPGCGSSEPSTEGGAAALSSASGTCSAGNALVPTMTSSTAPSGAVTQSGIYSAGYEGYRAFDGTTSTLWLSNMYTSSVWLGYDWGGPSEVVTSYQIVYANGSCCEQRGPRDWTLQGWNGSSWVVVDTQSGQSGWYTNNN